MKRFFVFAIIALGILFLTFALVFFFQDTEPTIPPDPSQEGKENGDTTPPVTGILSPKHLSWHNTGFSVLIGDLDRESGLADFVKDNQGCRYIIQDLGKGSTISWWRLCGEAELFVSVGEDGICSSSFSPRSSDGQCKVSTKAIDKAGNESDWRSRIFQVDFTPPLVEKILLPKEVLPGTTQIFEAKVTDNSKIVGCSLYLDAKKVEQEVVLSPIPCNNNQECSLSTSLMLDTPGEYAAFFGCLDIAGNQGFGQPAEFSVFQNHAPEIDFCRVTPTQGTPVSEFQFQVQAQDPDEDSLSFSWEFGDGASSQVQSPTYVYKDSGTYMPLVSVEDEAGEIVQCNTAWVVVGDR